MAKLVLNDIEAEVVEKLELRAKRLGTTPEEEASRLLRERLRTEPGPRAVEVPATKAEDAGSDPRFVRQHGFLVFTGVIRTEDIPDHRAIREERSDALSKGIDEGRV